MPLNGSLSIYPGEEIKVRYIGSAAPASLKGLARVEHTLGWEQYTLSDYAVKSSTFTVDRTPQILVPDSPGDAGTGGPGCIVTGGGLYIEEATPALKRGQFYARLLLLRAGLEECLCCGYLYSGKPFVAIGEHIEPGPGGGEGFRRWVSLAVDAAGNADTTYALALSNTIRKIYGFQLYYNCAAVAASRDVAVQLQSFGLAKPTGYAGSGRPWLTASTVLTTGEEGAVRVDEKFVSYNDNNALTYGSTATAPTPFPITVEENDLAEIRTVISLGDAGDVYSWYADIEEWLVI